jgi:hypothetical protein
MGMQATKITRFSNPNENKGMPNSKSRSWNKKNKNKNMKCVKQDSNKILLQRKNKIGLWQKKIYPKLMLNKLKVKGILFLLYSLDTYFKEIFQLPIHMWPIFTHVHLCVAHVHPCVNYEWIKIQLKMD